MIAVMPINNRTIPSLSSLIIFEASARLGTFSSAAVELCVTPTAVSKQIKQLEAFLNTTLFIRKKAGLELTVKGKAYLTTVSQTLITLADESQRMDDSNNPVALNVEIGACFSHFWLIPRLDDFRDKHPDIALNIRINNEHLLTKDVHDDYDVAFYYGAVNKLDKKSVLLFRERMLLVCSPDFLLKHPDSRDMSKLWQQPLLGLKDTPDFWENWQSWAGHHGIDYQPPQNEMQMEDQVAVIHAAMNGGGIALAWDWHVQDLIQGGELVALTTVVDCHNNAFFLTRSGESQSRTAECFFNWVVQLSK